MILSNKAVRKLLADGGVFIDPTPEEGQFDTSSLNLRVGEDFQRWKPEVGVEGCSTQIDLDLIDLTKIRGLSEPIEPEKGGYILTPPKAFVLVTSREYIRLPLESRVAARVEGRSKFARLGLAVHITAPTIHAGFAGKITLEIVNHGPFHLRIRPNETKLCQLIFEEVKGVPQEPEGRSFLEQDTALGRSPRKG
jgi:dCTP deaminase